MERKPKRTTAARAEEMEAWAQAVRQEIAELEGKLSPIQAELLAARQRLDLITRLIGLEAQRVSPTTAAKTSPGSECLVVMVESARKVDQADVPPAIPQGGSASWSLEEHIESLLRSANKPVHIRKIRQSLVALGVPLPGRGLEANIIVRLSRSPDRFARWGRGLYGLSEWKGDGLPEHSVQELRAGSTKKEGK